MNDKQTDEFKGLLSRALTNMTTSTIHSCIHVIEASKTRKQAVRELQRWLNEMQEADL